MRISDWSSDVCSSDLTVSRQSGRVSLLWQPNDTLQNLTVMSIDHVGGNSTATRLKTVDRCGDTNNGYALNCSADYLFNPSTPVGAGAWTNYLAHNPHANPGGKIGRASCRERVCQYV